MKTKTLHIVTACSLNTDDVVNAARQINKAFKTWRAQEYEVPECPIDITVKGKVTCSAQMWQLIVLTHYKGWVVTKDAISHWVLTNYPGNKELGLDQQPRHLKAIGVNVLGKGSELPPGYEIQLPDGTRVCKVPSGTHLLLNLEDLSPSYLAAREKRLAYQLPVDEMMLKATHCATCGDKAGERSRHDPSVTCVLHKGHMDPNKAAVVGNVIPQCQFCNRFYSNKCVFDKDGRVEAPANTQLMKKATKAVKRENYEYLCKEHEAGRI